MSTPITYPFLPEGRAIEYVPADNEFMLAAKSFAKTRSLDKSMPTGAVIVKGNQIIGRGANGSDFHEKHGCERVRLNIPTGTHYELCEGCSSVNHAEPRAVQDAVDLGNDPTGADIYLWGHWWACEPCWQAMAAAAINRVFLMEGSEILFNKLAKGNIVGHQFDSESA